MGWPSGEGDKPGDRVDLACSRIMSAIAIPSDSINSEFYSRLTIVNGVAIGIDSLLFHACGLASTCLWGKARFALRRYGREAITDRAAGRTGAILDGLGAARDGFEGGGECAGAVFEARDESLAAVEGCGGDGDEGGEFGRELPAGAESNWLELAKGGADDVAAGAAVTAGAAALLSSPLESVASVSLAIAGNSAILLPATLSESVDGFEVSMLMTGG